MIRLSLLTATLLVAVAVNPAAAQDFPAPGTGEITWQTVGPLLKYNAGQFGADGALYAGSYDSLHVFEPDFSGALTGRWRSLGPGRLGFSSVLPLDPAGDTLLVGAAAGGRLNRSTDHGATWTMVEGPAYIAGVSGGPKRPGGFYVVPPGLPHAGRILAGGQAFQFSDDRGATWTDADYPDPGLATEPGAFALMPSGRILAAGYWGVATTDDGGSSFQRTSVWGPFQFYGDGLAALATPSSTQSGAPSCGQADTTLCDGAVALSTEGPYEGVFAYRTSDGGRTWSERYPLPDPYDGIGYGYTAGVVALPPGPDGLGRALAILGRGMVYRTMDGAQSWQPIGRLPLGIEGNDWASYAVTGPDGHLWVMTEGAGIQPHGMYRSAERLDEVLAVSSESGPESGAGARLDVFPNPGREQMTVRVSVAEAARSASVSVYDALGRRVAVLHDGPLATGSYAFTLDSSKLAPGTYRIRIAGGTAASRSFTVVR